MPKERRFLCGVIALFKIKFTNYSHFLCFNKIK